MFVRASGGGDKTYVTQLSSYPTNGKVTVGFKPKYACAMVDKYGTSNTPVVHFFDQGNSPTPPTTYTTLFNGQTYTTNIGSTGASGFMSIDDDGFTLNATFSGNFHMPLYIVAIG